MSTDEYDRIRIRDLTAEVARLTESERGTHLEIQSITACHESEIAELRAEVARLTAERTPRPVPEGGPPKKPGWYLGRWSSGAGGDYKSATEMDCIWVDLCHGELSPMHPITGWTDIESVEVWGPCIPDLAARIEALEAEAAGLRESMLEERRVMLGRVDTLEAESTRLREESDAARQHAHANEQDADAWRAAQSAPSGLDEAEVATFEYLFAGNCPECHGEPVDDCDHCGGDGCATHEDTVREVLRHTSAATRELRAERDDARAKVVALQVAMMAARTALRRFDAAGSVFDLSAAGRTLDTALADAPAPTPDTGGPQEPTESRDPDNDADWPLPGSSLSWQRASELWFVDHAPSGRSCRCEGGDGDVFGLLLAGDFPTLPDLIRARNLAAQRKRATSPTEETPTDE